MNGSKSLPDCAAVVRDYEKALRFNAAIGLNDTVRTNENFFVGKQWEGVAANGLPTPVFNFIKRVTLFSVASVISDNLKLRATPASAAGGEARRAGQCAADTVTRELEDIAERVRLGSLLRELMRNAAVDGDGCLYSYWDAEEGGIVTEVVENNRVFFGNPSDRRVQRQPWIIISSRQMTDDVRAKAKESGLAFDGIADDGDDREIDAAKETDGKVTVLLRFWKSRETGTVWACECTKGAMVKKPWDTRLALYPIVWLSWDFVQDCYHGQALITGLIPNQIFINKLFAMSMISLMTTAYPKIVYDRTRIARWDNRVGAAIGVNGGDVGSVAKIINPAQISPQIAEFIRLAVDYTQTFLGATPAALGDEEPDNASAILALQHASAVPSELTRQNLHQCVEELGRIYMDFMAACYGTRMVRAELPQEALNAAEFAGRGAEWAAPFDFSLLRRAGLGLKLDVGASSYWSEIASLQTLDNLLLRDKISVVDYLERIPDGYIAKRGELIDSITARQSAALQQNSNLI